MATLQHEMQKRRKRAGMDTLFLWLREDRWLNSKKSAASNKVQTFYSLKALLHVDQNYAPCPVFFTYILQTMWCSTKGGSILLAVQRKSKCDNRHCTSPAPVLDWSPSTAGSSPAGAFGRAEGQACSMFMGPAWTQPYLCHRFWQQ